MKCSDLRTMEAHERLYITVMIGMRSLEEKLSVS